MSPRCIPNLFFSPGKLIKRQQLRLDKYIRERAHACHLIHHFLLFFNYGLCFNWLVVDFLEVAHWDYYWCRWWLMMRLGRKKMIIASAFFMKSLIGDVYEWQTNFHLSGCIFQRSREMIIAKILLNIKLYSDFFFETSKNDALTHEYQ